MLDERRITIIRKKREIECFKYCDRAAWYDTLTPDKKREVRVWRKKWLDATKTGILPNPPAWVK